ncbi:hypothetical protein TWF694_009800 [Orbilia ellipsospora]|uniref:Haloacid dehalogenase n=1 Tax=Orbilia ellipsospora TaxID=2528407 RepID=A0AAV9XD37_9PEZI
MTSLKPPAHTRTLKTIPEAFVFDVFGTVFDWRGTVSTYLERTIAQKLTRKTISENKKLALTAPDSLKIFCASFAQEWRDSYKQFVATRGSASQELGTEEEYTTIDTHHYRSLLDLFEKYGLLKLFSASEMYEISKTWHFLNPWEDSTEGISKLRELGVVSTLSNGNVRLLIDLGKSSGVTFDMVLSGQLWDGYKPHPKVYIGACEVLGVGDRGAWEVYKDIHSGSDDSGEEEWRRGERGKVAMVAAHIGDLRAAKKCGLTTIYIERPGEDDDREAGEKYIRDGEDWIDMWVTHEEGGILEAAKRLAELKEI